MNDTIHPSPAANQANPATVRELHYANLNYYYDLPGYAESRQSYETMQAFFAQIVGHSWEIDEAIYDDFV